MNDMETRKTLIDEWRTRVAGCVTELPEGSAWGDYARGWNDCCARQLELLEELEDDAWR